MNILYRSSFLIPLLLWLLAGPALATDYYVNGDGGSNGNDGRSAETPFRTIQYAATQMAAGDVCLIAGGTYRESISVTTSNVSFRPLNDERVIITATRVIDDWSVYQGNIYQTTLDESFGQVSQVFFNQKEMEMARFPNNTSDNFLRPTVGIGDGGTRPNDNTHTLEDDALAASGVDWTGALLWVVPGPQWVSFGRPIASASGNSVTYTVGNANPYNNRPGTRYFLYNKLEALDVAEEWFYDANTRTLYFQAPGGVDPSSTGVEVRSDLYALTVQPGANNVSVEGLHFYAASVKLAGNQGTIDNCRVVYPTPWFFVERGFNRGDLNEPAFREEDPGLGVTLTGEGNTIQNSEISFSWGDGVSLLGTNHTVNNCLIHDVDASATDCAGVATAGSGHRITNNTIYATGRAGIVHRLTSDLLIRQNDIYRFGAMTSDLGGTYCYQTFEEPAKDANGEIAYNWIHDPQSGFTGEEHNQREGIYLDNRSRGFLVHHNVVWNLPGRGVGIRTNTPTRNNQLYHNTLWNIGEATRAQPDTIRPVNQKIYNNLSSTGIWYGDDVQNNFVVPDPGFVDAANGDFRLTQNSRARNRYGVQRDLYNGGFENRFTYWSAFDNMTGRLVSSPVRSGSTALHVDDRKAHWAGPRQNITDLVQQHGNGTYVLEAWVRTASGTATAVLRANVDDDQYLSNSVAINSTEWTRVTTTADITTANSLSKVVFELMTSAKPDLYVDDCRVSVPAGSNLTGEGAVIIAGINDEVSDGQPDAGAYEFGNDWTAGTSVQPSNVDEWFSSTPTNPTNPNPDGTIVIRAQGDCGSEIMELHVDGTKVDEWTVSTSAANYTYPDFGGGDVSVHFRGDTFGQEDPTCQDSNLEVDYLEVCGTRYQTEVVATKADCCPWDPDKLYSEGGFEFGPLSCAGSALALSGSVSVYPNPTAEELTVQGGQDYQLQLYDLTGRPIMQHDHLRGSATLDVSHLRPGVYLMKVEDAQGESYQQRVIIE